MESDIHHAFQSLLDEAKTIITDLGQRKIPIRIIGALAFYHQCPSHRDLYDRMARIPTDIDFIAYSKNRGDLTKYLEARSYEGLHRLNVLYGMRRQIFKHKETGLYIDIFYDVLDMCHKVEFRNRLGFDPITVSLTDLVLEKMQIVQINEKDIKDSILLFLEHDLSEKEETRINAGYIADVLSKDWGYYYTVTINLKKIKDLLVQYDWIPPDGKNLVMDRIDRLLQHIEDKPKSSKWKMRAKVGTKRQWYQDVGGERAAVVQQNGSWTTQGGKDDIGV
jgi:hypothetical protein